MLDEPFSHIDNFKKQSLRRNVFKYLKENNITCILATHDKDDVLGFADYMMVIHNSKIIRTGHPETLYNNPKTPLVASFFDEFSIIDDEIYYAHQLQILENASKKAIVLGCYFNGNNWLIEAVNNNNKLLIYHTDKVIKGEIIHFKIIN